VALVLRSELVRARLTLSALPFLVSVNPSVKWSAPTLAKVNAHIHFTNRFFPSLSLNAAKKKGIGFDAVMSYSGKLCFNNPLNSNKSNNTRSKKSISEQMIFFPFQ
jgi:hypothetical protein